MASGDYATRAEIVRIFPVAPGTGRAVTRIPSPEVRAAVCATVEAAGGRSWLWLVA